jgi:hypothetical protein
MISSTLPAYSRSRESRPSGRYGTVATAVATIDGPITFEATMRFDATGRIGRVSASAVGDHEVALEARCAVIETSALSPSGGNIDDRLFHDCGATRLSSETVVIAPAIRTQANIVRFPFCPESPPTCTGPWGARYRPRSQLSITPVPTAWGLSRAFPLYWFAVMPSATSAETVSLSAPLATGEIATTSVAIPPVL